MGIEHRHAGAFVDRLVFLAIVGIVPEKAPGLRLQPHLLIDITDLGVFLRQNIQAIALSCTHKFVVVTIGIVVIFLEIVKLRHLLKNIEAGGIFLPFPFEGFAGPHQVAVLGIFHKYLQQGGVIIVRVAGQRLVDVSECLVHKTRLNERIAQVEVGIASGDGVVVAYPALHPHQGVLEILAGIGDDAGVIIR